MATRGDVATVGGVAAAPRTNPWILGRWRDLALFVGTPVLIIPFFFLLRQKMSVETIALYVAAFGATGHHLPGMMRAYGDKALFERFKLRFIVAPIFLVAVCVLFTMYELSAVVLAVYLWGAWHGLAQIYGFVRIYDAKARSFEEITKRLDFAMCVCWIFCGMVWSPSRVYFLFELLYVKCGVPLPAAGVIFGFQMLVAIITGLVTVAFIANHVRLHRAGQSPSMIKVLLLATSFGFWWYANFSFSNLLVGVALFEIFHDVQYLSIVWVYNKGRADKDPQAGSFTRFLFRRSGVLIGLYVGMVFAYGSMQLVARGIPEETMKNALVGLLTASALLHFYYDGFIWKVREKKTAEALGVKGRDIDEEPRRGLPPWAAHLAKWSLFIVPLFALGMLEPSKRDQNFQRLQNLGTLIPENPLVHNELGMAYSNMGRLQDAEVHFKKAVEHGSDLVSPQHNLGEIYLSRNDYDAAVTAFTAALEVDPEYAESLCNLGVIELRRENYDAAAAYLERTIAIDPYLVVAYNNLGRVYNQQDRREDAVATFQKAIEVDDANAAAHRLLAATLQNLGRRAEAIRSYDAAIDLDPQDLTSLINRGVLHSLEGNHAAARLDLEQVLAQRPRFVPALVQYGYALDRSGDRAGAIVQLRKAVELNPNAEAAAKALAAMEAEAGSTPPAPPDP